MPKSPKESESAAQPAKAEAPAQPPASPAEPTKKEKPAKGKEGRAPKGGKGGGTPGGAAKGPAPGRDGGKPIPDNPNFRYIVRIAGSDLDGRRPTALALTGVRGVGLRIAETACQLAQVSPSEMIGNLPEPTVEGLEQLLGQLPQRLPPWMVNHTLDRAAGETHHFIAADLETSRRDDVNVMKMIRSYRGVRHERGQKVRGQRTRSNGRTGMAAGVLKKAAKEAAQAKGKEGAAAEKKE
jgi:small subunit ribosomal protein S13